MCLAELETAARLGRDLRVVVFDDATLTLIAIKQGAGQGGEEAVRYRADRLRGRGPRARTAAPTTVADAASLEAAVARRDRR